MTLQVTLFHHCFCHRSKGNSSTLQEAVNLIWIFYFNKRARLKRNFIFVFKRFQAKSSSWKTRKFQEFRKVKHYLNKSRCEKNFPTLLTPNRELITFLDFLNNWHVCRQVVQKVFCRLRILVFQQKLKLFKSVSKRMLCQRLHISLRNKVIYTVVFLKVCTEELLWYQTEGAIKFKHFTNHRFLNSFHCTQFLRADQQVLDHRLRSTLNYTRPMFQIF